MGGWGERTGGAGGGGNPHTLYSLSVKPLLQQPRSFSGPCPRYKLGLGGRRREIAVAGMVGEFLDLSGAGSITVAPVSSPLRPHRRPLLWPCRPVGGGGGGGVGQGRVWGGGGGAPKGDVYMSTGSLLLLLSD